MPASWRRAAEIRRFFCGNSPWFAGIYRGFAEIRRRFAEIRRRFAEVHRRFEGLVNANLEVPGRPNTKLEACVSSPFSLGRPPRQRVPVARGWPSFPLPCERGLNSHTDVITRPRLSLAL